MAAGKGSRGPELSFQEGKGFKKSIGYYVGDDGKSRQKVWWLGHHKETAQQAVRALTAIYAEQGGRASRGHGAWSARLCCWWWA